MIATLKRKPENIPRKIGLISNPHSRRNRSVLGKISDIVAEHPNIHHQITQNSDDVDAALEKLASAGVEVVAINGGDGTVARALTSLLQRQPFKNQPAVIMLPGGTTNMNASDSGMTGNLLKNVQRLIDWSVYDQHHARSKQRPVLRVDGAVSGTPACGMCFGAGAITQGIEHCHKNVHSRGLINEIGPGITTLRTIWGIARKDPRFDNPIPMRIAFNQQSDPLSRDVLMFLASGMERMFLGLRPFWGKEAGALHITWIQRPADHLLRSILSILKGKPNRHASPQAGYFSHNTDEISLSMDGDFALDGELYHADATSGPIVISNAGNLEFLSIHD